MALIKSVLLSLHTYYLSLFTISSHMSNRLENCREIFSNMGEGMQFKSHLVDWNTL